MNNLPFLTLISNDVDLKFYLSQKTGMSIYILNHICEKLIKIEYIWDWGSLENPIEKKILNSLIIKPKEYFNYEGKNAFAIGAIIGSPDLMANIPYVINASRLDNGGMYFFFTKPNENGILETFVDFTITNKERKEWIKILEEYIKNNSIM
jgi:hypothetical protein